MRNPSVRMRLALAMAVAAAGCGPRPATAPAKAPERPTAPLRRTPYVEVFEACKGSVVKFTATRKERKTDDKGKTTTVTHTQWGSGCIIHPDGYVVSNAHMLRFDGARVAETFDGSRLPCRLIAADDANDLALLKIDRAQPFTPLRFARSADALIGEPAIVIGSPFGIRFTLATGIISGLRRGTNTDFAHLHGLIQTDAAINPGSSGGPLLNIRGRLLGICVSSKRDADNIGFVIPSDHVRRILPGVISPEKRYGYTLGLKVAPCGPAVVAAVEPGSPAAAAGLRKGDLITHIAGAPIRCALDVALALVGRKGRQRLDIRIVRHDDTRTLRVTLGAVPHRPADVVEGLVPGLAYSVYQRKRGQWRRLPDLAKLKPAAAGTMDTVGLGDCAGKDGFAIELRGYLKVAMDGVYVFHLTSDDGSRLWIGDRLVVDHDGLHGATTRRGFIALRAGHHPLRLAMFDSGGDEALALAWEGPGFARQPLPKAALWRTAGEAPASVK